MSLSKHFFFSLGIFLFVSSQLISAEEEFQVDVIFDDLLADVPIGEEQIFNFTLKINTPKLNVASWQIDIKSNSSRIAKVSECFTKKINNEIWSGNFTVVAINIGNARINGRILNENGAEIQELRESMQISVTRAHFMHADNHNQIFFFWFMYFVMILTNVIFGTILNIKRVGAIFKKPSGLCVSFLLTVIIIPVVSLTILL